MKTIACLTLFLFCCLALPAIGQTDKSNEPWSVNEGTLVGAGGYNIKDSYLSDLKYTGWGLRVMNERMKVTRLADYRISRQQIIGVDVSSTHNPAENTSDFSGFVDYTLGYHYRFQVLPNLKLLAGASAHFMGGFIYNTRNSNNPASAKVDIDLNISAVALYNVQIGNYPLTLRYQLEIPFAGALFSPHYGQSYFEIFNQGNTSGIIRFSSFHNKLAMKNYITADFPVGNLTVRAGYLNSSYRLSVSNIDSHILSNSFVIGIVKEFVAFGGKRLKHTHKYKSAYY